MSVQFIPYGPESDSETQQTQDITWANDNSRVYIIISVTWPQQVNTLLDEAVIHIYASPGPNELSWKTINTRTAYKISLNIWGSLQWRHMSVMASQISGNWTACSTDCSG